MKRIATLLAVVLLLTSCVSMKVQSVKNLEQRGAICIVQNPYVRGAFRDAYARQLEAVGFETTIVSAEEQSGCELSTTYSAKYGQHWGTYLAESTLTIYRKGERIGQAYYRAPYVSLEKHGKVEGKIEKMVAGIFES